MDLGRVVTEVGADYVVADDPAGVVQAGIWVTSIRSIMIAKLPKE